MPAVKMIPYETWCTLASVLDEAADYIVSIGCFSNWHFGSPETEARLIAEHGECWCCQMVDRICKASNMARKLNGQEPIDWDDGDAQG